MFCNSSNPIGSCIDTQSSGFDIPREPFFFIRHGSTNWTLDSLSDGPQDLEINEKGWKEAQIASKILANEIEERFNGNQNEFLIISSTLKRSINTAEVISNNIKIPMILKSGLEEKYFGDFRLEKKFCDKTKSLIPIDAESDVRFQERISRTIKEIFETKKFNKCTKILVSHGEVFKFLSKQLTSEEKKLPRGGVCVFIPNLENNSKWTVEFLSE